MAASINAAAPRFSRARGGCPAVPDSLIVKILVLQQLYNLTGDALEYQLSDRGSFLCFLVLTESSSILDAKTIWLFQAHILTKSTTSVVAGCGSGHFVLTLLATGTVLTNREGRWSKRCI